MDSVKVEWFNSGASIGQVYSMGLEYALVNERNQQCHDFVYCKDFFQDVIQATLHDRRAQIYSFVYDPSQMPKYDLGKTRFVLVNNADSHFELKIPGVVDFVNQFCSKLRLSRTAVAKVTNPPKAYERCGAFLFTGSGRWINSPVMVSMYSLLLRVGFIHKAGEDCEATVKALIDGKLMPYQSHDRSQMTQAWPGIQRILQLGYRRHFYIDTKRNYPKEVDISTMHNGTGIIAFTNRATDRVVPYWNRKSLDKAPKSAA